MAKLAYKMTAGDEYLSLKVKHDIFFESRHGVHRPLSGRIEGAVGTR